MKKTFLTAVSAALLLSAPMAVAQQASPEQNATSNAPAALPLDQDIHALQKEWAHIQYEVTDEDAQETQMAALVTKAKVVQSKYPDKAEPKVWEAIILSSEAGINGGLGALSLVEEARTLLLSAEKIDPNALGGAVYISLGSLYYRVPGWPLGFGDDSKARAYLEHARTVNPDGIDSNYFYGDFLIEQGENEKAVNVLKHALQAAPRPNRPVADAGRRKEILAALAKAQ